MQQVVFILAKQSWDTWLPPFLIDQSFNTSILYYDSDDNRPISTVAEIALTYSPETVILLSHHLTLARDCKLGKLLEQQGVSNVVYQPINIARLAYDKSVMMTIADKIQGLNIIPELSVAEAIELLSNNRSIVCKLRSGTEGNGFINITDVCQFYKSYLELSPDQRQRYILQPFILGDEYSVVVAARNKNIQIYEPVFKQPTSLEGIHPSRRRRYVPFRPDDPSVIDDLINITRKFAKILNFNGLLELEFIYGRNGRLHFLELNPRLAGTMRMVVMASTKNIFCELAKLMDSSDSRFEVVSTKSYAAEIPCGRLSCLVEKYIKSLANVSISSRISICDESRETLEEKILKIEAVLQANSFQTITANSDLSETFVRQSTKETEYDNR